MTDEKVIMLIEAKIQPERRAEIIEAARQYLPLVRSEPGVEAFYLTCERTIPLRLFFTRSIGRRPRRIFICNRTSQRNS